MVDALVSRADEGRGIAAKSSGEPLTRLRSGDLRDWETIQDSSPGTAQAEGTQGTETSKYLQERKETSTPQVAASERGSAQTGTVSRLRPLLYRGRGTCRVIRK
jgi:hypothetical protein